MPLVAVGRIFVAVALIGLGVEHFVFHEFVIGRAPPWPDGVPGKLVWVDITGVLVILAGLSIVMRRRERQTVLALALVVLVWALVRHVPIVAGDVLLAGSWTRAGKALAFVGGLLAVAGSLPPDRSSNATGSLVRLGGICLGVFLVIAGLQHFKFTAIVVTLIPGWIPGNATWWARLAGVALIAGGLGLLVRRTASLAGLMTGLMLFFWFWIVHLPRTFVSVSDGIALFEALAFAGIALVVAGALREPCQRRAAE
jgi:uncharacterized membrane protein